MTLLEMAPLQVALITLGVLIALATLIFWIAMIRDCWRATEAGSRERWVWLAIIVFGKLFGAVAYYLLSDRIGRSPGMTATSC